jgi:hypothetical protein
MTIFMSSKGYKNDDICTMGFKNLLGPKYLINKVNEAVIGYMARTIIEKTVSEKGTT